jgi:AraC-like DNA-binding protein
VTAAPHPLLRPLLERAYAGFVEATVPRRLVLPATASIGLIVKLRDSPLRPPSFVMGAHGVHTVLDGACAPSYLEMWLRPLAAYTLLGIPISELHGQIVDVTDVFGAAGRQLTQRVREEPTWDRRFHFVDELLLARLDTGPRPAPEIRRAWQRLVAGGGSVPIRQVAAEVGWSHKHLITRFRQQVGLTPKTAARLVRFDRVLCGVDGPGRPGWEQIAAESGYADQSHLVRDFRTFTGTTPTAFLKESTQRHAR